MPTLWNSIPDDPERDGWHWIGFGGWIEPRYWFAPKPPIMIAGYWRGGSPDETARLRYLENWATAYINFLDNFPNSGAKIAVDFDDFLSNPEETLQRICFALNLPFAAEALRYWSIRQHCVGGNREVRRSLVSNDTRTLQIAPRGASQRRFSRSTDPDKPPEITRVYERLQQL